jgi:hypothetical protein
LNIDWIIPCRYCEVHDNLATVIGAGIDTWWVPEFPHSVQVLIAVRLLATRDELGPEHEHVTRNIIRDVSGTAVSDLQQPFKAGVPAEVEQAHAEWLNGIAMVTLIQFEATEEGTYTFEHIVDGSTKSVPLHVRQGPPPVGVAL